MRVAILGPLEVHNGAGPTEVGGGRLRALLARLTLDAGRVVSASALAEAVWDDELPADELHALQSLVSRLRRSLGDAGLVEQGAGGYRLTLDPEQVDALRFERLAAAGSAALRAGDHDGAATILREALALWRGRALAGLTGERRFASAAAARLEDLRLAAIADRIDADLALGRAVGLVSELETLVARHPLHERLAAQQVAALYAAGRQSDALAAYERVRARLDDELGVTPSRYLLDAHMAVLRGEDAHAVGPRGADAHAVGLRGADAHAVGPRGADAHATSPRADVAAAAGTRGDPVPRPTHEPAPERARPRRSNLRAALTSFVGRGEDRERIGALLKRHRLVTLVGPGGAGKTRLANELSAQLVDTIAGGVWLVELAPLSDGDNLVPTLLAVLGSREANLLEHGAPVPGAQDGFERLVEALELRDTLLVMDNCEHLVADAAALVERLLARCPPLRVLATSREPLGIDGEHLAIVAPLGLPAEGQDPAAALAHPSVQLFADRAAAASAGFVVDDDTVAAVIEICRRLDGLPLAIELAAARLRSLPVAQVAARLDDRFRLLTGGSRTALARQRTLRAVVDWSWELLSDPERLLAARIAVFPAGVTPETAAAVCAGDGVERDDVLDLLGALVDRSLLVLADPVAPRYRMLETLREYGIEKLAEAGDLARMRTAHARYFAELVDEADPQLRGPDQIGWFRRVGAERDNVQAALRWLCDDGDARRALRLAVSLSWFWLLSASATDALAFMRLAVAVPGDADPLDRLVAEQVVRLSDLLTMPHNEDDDDGDDDRWGMAPVLDALDTMDLTSRPLLFMVRPALAWLFGGDDGGERADRWLDQAREHPDPWVRASVPLMLAQLAENDGAIDEMRERLAEADVAFHVIGDRWALATVLESLGWLRILDGDLDGAAAALVEAQALLAELGASGDGAMLSLRLADVRARQGDLDAARIHAQSLVDASDGVGEGAALALGTLAAYALLADDPDGALALQARALEAIGGLHDRRPDRRHVRALVYAVAASIERVAGDPERGSILLHSAYADAAGTKDLPIMAMVGVTVADATLAAGRARDAAEMLAAAAALRGSPDQTDVRIARLTRELREALGEAGFAAAWDRGHALEREAAIARLAPSDHAPAVGA
jgi:predicted ATPase/DNA-binding SARP family transcriptional activator